MEIFILLFACVALLNFTSVGAMYGEVARISGKRKLHTCHIPENSEVYIQKVIDGEDAPNDVVSGKLRFHEILPPPSYVTFGYVQVYILDEHGHIYNREGVSSMTRLWMIKHYQDHGKDGFDNSEKTRYRCTIDREPFDKLYAFLEPRTYEEEHNAGDAIVSFVNQHGVPYVGTLHPAVAPSVAALPPPAPLQLEYVPLKKRKTNFAGSSSNPHAMID